MENNTILVAAAVLAGVILLFWWFWVRKTAEKTQVQADRQAAKLLEQAERDSDWGRVGR